MTRPVGVLRDRQQNQRVTNAELFFDLVYVFAVTQLSHLLLSHPGVRTALQSAILLGLVWLAWVYTTWVTNWLDPDRLSVRIMLLALSLGSLVLSAGLPHAFGSWGWVVAAAYAAMQVGRGIYVVIVLRRERATSLQRNFERILCWSAASAALVLAGAAVDGNARAALWVAAVAVDLIGSWLGFYTPGLGRSKVEEWTISGDHFAERCQAFILIALGESVVVIGATLSEDEHITFAVVLAFAAAFLGAIGFWWMYFDRSAGAAAEIIAESENPGALGSLRVSPHPPGDDRRHHRHRRRGPAAAGPPPTGGRQRAGLADAGRDGPVHRRARTVQGDRLAGRAVDADRRRRRAAGVGAAGPLAARVGRRRARPGGVAGRTGQRPVAMTDLQYSSARGRWVLAATVLGSGVASLDATVVGIALPTIGKDFHSDVASLQWVVTAYTLTLAAFLLLGGTLGDRFGRKRIFMIGVVWFALASMLCAVAPTAGFLIGARALQGVGGALLTPGSLAILQASFAPADRSRAIGAWSGLGGVAAAAGPLVGGYLLAVGSWRWVFIINLPLSAAVLWISRRHVPESLDPSNKGRIDLPGATWAVIGLGSLTYSLIEAPSAGWTSPAIITGLVLSVVGIVAFILTERHSRNPMLPPTLFTSQQFVATNLVTFLVYAALAGALFLLPVQLQQVNGYTPLQAGLSLLPLTLMMLLFSARSGRLAARIGPRLQMSVGPIIAGAGLYLLTRSSTDGNYLTGVLPGVLVLSIGLVITVAPLTSTAMSSAPGGHSGIASAVNNDVARAGGLIAVALLPLVSSLTGDAYLYPAQFAAGFRTAAIICAFMCAGGGVLAALTIRNTLKMPDEDASVATA